MNTITRLTAAVLAAGLLAGGAFGEGVTATLKGGYFAPSDALFKDVYSGGPVFGLDVTVPVGGVFHVWAGADLFGKTGELTLTLEDTKVRVTPLYIGLRAEFGKTGVRPYAGAAAAYFLFHEENVLGTVSESGLGVLAQAGVRLRIGGPVWADLHAGYRGCTVKTDGDDPLEAKLDGLQAGLGLAYRF